MKRFPHLSMPLSRRTALKTMLGGLLATGSGKATAADLLPAEQPRRGRDRTLTVDSNLTILVLPEESQPVRKAAQDLAADFAKVFGKAPAIVDKPEAAGPVALWVGETSRLLDGLRPAEKQEPESFSISVAEVPLHPGRTSHVVTLTGPDVRGVIYATYQFSEEFLGVDPLYYWTDREPVRRSQIKIPADLNHVYPAPVFRYRGFFINDEDLLTGWAPDEKTGISLEVWDRIYETILRLKGNMICPGTWIFPDEPQIQLAGQRGLIIAQHHASPLGVNVARWPKGVPYNYTTHPEILDRAWKNAAEAYPRDVEVLWAVGLRGLSDVGYTSMDASVRGNDKALGHLISKAVARQMQIVRSIHPDAQFVFSTWDEGSALVSSGDLVIPPEVHTVWADTGYGYLQDKGRVSAGEGMYYHVAMMNYKANQLTEMVPVERIYSEFNRYIQAGATYYLLLNTSDIRPVPMTTRAVMDLAWRGIPSGGAAAPAGFLRDWAHQQFGPRAAQSLAEIYEDYFVAPAHFGDPPREYGDQIYHVEGRKMMMATMTDTPMFELPAQAPRWEQPHIYSLGYFEGGRREWLARTAREQARQCGQAQGRWDAVWNKALAARPLVEPARLDFYQAHVLTMIAINREGNRALLAISNAILAAQSGAMDQAGKHAAEILEALDAIQKAQAAAEYGKWKNWYRGDWLVGVYRTRQIAEIFASYLADPFTRLAPPLYWDNWEGYYYIMRHEGHRTVNIS